jgi:hypothetical protein
MNTSLKRYTPDMLLSLGSQSLPSIALNAVVRGVLFTGLMQLLSFVSVGQISTVAAMAVLALIFTFIIFSIDLIEKYASRELIRHRG